MKPNLYNIFWRIYYKLNGKLEEMEWKDINCECDPLEVVCVKMEK